MSEQLEQEEERKPAREFAPEGWGYDFCGVLVDLRGLRPGEDGREPIYLSKLSEESK